MQMFVGLVCFIQEDFHLASKFLHTFTTNLQPKLALGVRASYGANWNSNQFAQETDLNTLAMDPTSKKPDFICLVQDKNLTLTRRREKLLNQMIQRSPCLLTRA
jgi:hypothetical protein